VAVQDLPEVPTIVVSEEQEQKLDLPDVPTKPPVLVDDAEISSAEVPTKRKGQCLSVSFPHSLSLYVHVCVYKQFNNLTIFKMQFWRNHCQHDQGKHLQQYFSLMELLAILYDSCRGDLNLSLYFTNSFQPDKYLQLQSCWFVFAIAIILIRPVHNCKFIMWITYLVFG
jgi:hypothetical protein